MPLIEVRGLKTYFYTEEGVVRAVDGVDFSIEPEKTLGMVGESGCGKSVTARSIMGLIKMPPGKIEAGEILYLRNGNVMDLTKLDPKGPEMRSIRGNEIAMIFQEPMTSLNPRMTVGAIVGEPLLVHDMAKGSERKDRVREVLAAVGMKPDHMKRYPHEFSGGQRQRIAIARALALGPQLIVADEPVSALDVSIQAQVINLLEELQQEFGLTYLFIAHDLSVIKHISNRVAVMYLGKIVELVKTEELFSNPKHPYTEALMSAVPVPDPDYNVEEIILTGDVPSPVNPPSGCYFHPRCRYAREICKTEAPAYRDLGGEHFVTCHFADSLNLKPIQTG